MLNDLPLYLGAEKSKPDIYVVYVSGERLSQNIIFIQVFTSEVSVLDPEPHWTYFECGSGSRGKYINQNEQP